MSEPNERQIEKLLKSAGARRCEQAGTPEMHPATREMLQTEVRRQYGAVPAKAKGGFAGLLRWLPRVAVFVALGVCAWLLWFRDGEDSPIHLALKEEAPAMSVEEGGRLRSEPEARAAGQPLAESGERMSADEITEIQPLPLAVSPAPVDAPAKRAVSVQRDPGQDDSKSVVGADFFKSDRQAMYMGTAAAEAEQKDLVEGDPGTALAVLMDSTPADSRTGMALQTLSGKARLQTAVLQNFTVVNEGSAVRFIDADGSTYEGVLRPVTRVAASRSKGGSTVKADRMSPTPKPSSVSGALNGLVLLNYKVLASGTNRSLNQTIQFQGNLALTEQQVELGRNVFSNTVLPITGREAGPTPGREGPVVPGRLYGTAVLDDGQDVKVDAVLATP